MTEIDDVDNLRDELNSIESDINTLQSDVSDLESTVSTNSSNISTNQSDINTLQSDVSDNEGEIQDSLGISDIKSEVVLIDYLTDVGMFENTYDLKAQSDGFSSNNTLLHMNVELNGVSWNRPDFYTGGHETGNISDDGEFQVNGRVEGGQINIKAYIMYV